MPKTNLIDTLPDRTRSLVLDATKDLPAAFGDTEEDQAQIHLWFEKSIGKTLVANKAEVELLESYLLSRTYLVADSFTAADVVVYVALHEIISKENPKEHYSHPALTRYFDHIQSRRHIRAAAGSPSSGFSLVPIDLENAPKQNRSSEASKKKGDKISKSVPAEMQPTIASETPSAIQSPRGRDKELKRQQAEPKDKKGETKTSEKSRKIESKSGVATSAEAAAPVPSMIDLRVGHIIDVQKHPDADGLYVEQIDVGEEAGTRTVVSGLVNYIPIEQMRNKWLIVVCNLKPVAMRGVKSYAMVLCATHRDGKEGGIEIVDPPPGSKPGDRVYFEGPYESDIPLEQLNPKKKIFETIQPGFTTLESHQTAWVDPVNKVVHRLRTENGYCTVPSFVGASLS